MLHASLLHAGHKEMALTRVVNAGAQEGLQASGVLQELLNFNFEGEIAARMSQFDRDIDRYEKASGENFPNNNRRCLAHDAGRSVDAAPCPQQHSAEHVGDAESQERKCQTRTGCCHLDAAAHGPVSVWCPRTRHLPEGQVARKGQ